MLSNSEITAANTTRPITDIAAKLGVDEHDLIPYGHQIAKVSIDAFAQ